MLGHLEGGRYAGEILDFASAGFGIEPFDIASLTLFDGGAHIDFDEVTGTDDIGSHLTQFVVGADESGEGDDAGIDKEFGYLCDAADVLASVFGSEAEIVVDTRTDVVAIKDATEQSAPVQLTLQSDGDGALAGATEAGEPHHLASLTEQRFFIGATQHLVEDWIDIVF